MGGLGNQMWIVAAAYVVSAETGCPLYIPRHTGCNPHNTRGNDYTATVFSAMGPKAVHTDVSAAVLHERLRYMDDWHEVRPGPPPHGGFAAWSVAGLGGKGNGDHPHGFLMASYFQYWDVLAPHEAALRACFLAGLGGHVARIQEVVGPDPASTAFVHVRRGDYVALSHIHVMQTQEYYRECLGRLRAANPGLRRVFVLSDDPEWCRAQPLFAPGPPSSTGDDALPLLLPEMVYPDPAVAGDELLTLALMACCKGGAICANSTFSWWGAFLGDAPHVYLPSRWIDTVTVVNICPGKWTQV